MSNNELDKLNELAEPVLKFKRRRGKTQRRIKSDNVQEYEETTGLLSKPHKGRMGTIKPRSTISVKDVREYEDDDDYLLELIVNFNNVLYEIEVVGNNDISRGKSNDTSSVKIDEIIDHVIYSLTKTTPPALIVCENIVWVQKVIERLKNLRINVTLADNISQLLEPVNPCTIIYASLLFNEDRVEYMSRHYKFTQVILVDDCGMNVESPSESLPLIVPLTVGLASRDHCYFGILTVIIGSETQSKVFDFLGRMLLQIGQNPPPFILSHS